MTLLPGMTHPDEEGGTPTAIVGHRTAVVGAAMFYVGDTPDHDDDSGDDYHHSPANYFAGSTDSLIGGGGSPQYTNVWPPSSTAAAADGPQPVCDGQGGHHHYHHQLDIGGHADAAAAEEEETIKRRLKFFFMNPVEKYAAGGQLPWKLLLQAAKVILVTTQLVVFANMRFVHVNYMSGQTLALQHHFIKVGGETDT
jgi:hypothetical protein